MDARTSQVVAKAEADEVQFVSLQLTDIFGIVKNVTIPVDQLRAAFARGVNSDGSSVEGLARVCESDMVLRPDASTYNVLPRTEAPQRTARLICDVNDTEGRPFDGDPRQILRRVLAQAKDMGYTYHTGPEVEFFLFRMDGKPQVTRCLRTRAVTLTSRHSILRRACAIRLPWRAGRWALRWKLPTMSFPRTARD